MLDSHLLRRMIVDARYEIKFTVFNTQGHEFDWVDTNRTIHPVMYILYISLMPQWVGAMICRL